MRTRKLMAPAAAASALLAALLLGCSDNGGDGSPKADTAAKTPQQQVHDALGDMIAMLEAGEAGEFLEKHVVPEELEKVKAKSDFDEIVRNFKEHKVERLLKCLRLAHSKAVPCEIRQEGTLAGFRGKDIPRKGMWLRKIGERWYLMDRAPRDSRDRPAEAVQSATRPAATPARGAVPDPAAAPGNAHP